MGIEGTQSINLKCHSCSSLHRLNTVWNILIHFADKSLFALDWTWMIALFLMLIIRNGKGFHSWADGNFRHHLFCTAALISDNDWQDFDYFNQVSWWQDWTTMAPDPRRLLLCWIAGLLELCRGIQERATEQTLQAIDLKNILHKQQGLNTCSHLLNTREESSLPAYMLCRGWHLDLINVWKCAKAL